MIDRFNKTKISGEDAIRYCSLLVDLQPRTLSWLGRHIQNKVDSAAILTMCTLASETHDPSTRPFGLDVGTDRIVLVSFLGILEDGGTYLTSSFVQQVDRCMRDR